MAYNPRLKRTQTLIERDGRILIKTEIVDEAYENCTNVIDYKDVDPGVFVVKEEPDENLGFISQIKTEDNFHLPQLYGLEPESNHSETSKKSENSKRKPSSGNENVKFPSEGKQSLLDIPSSSNDISRFKINKEIVGYARETITESEDNEHLSQKINSKLLCYYCNFKSWSKKEMKSHVFFKHSSVCQYCSFIIYPKEDLNKHINSNHIKLIEQEKCDDYIRKRVVDMIPPDKRYQNGDYKCHSCDKDFNLLSDWINHMVLFLKCEGCYPTVVKQNISDVKKFRRESMDHFSVVNNTFKCNSCSYSSNYKNNCIKHFTHRHHFIKYKCPFCKTNLPSISLLKRHLSVRHNPLKPILKCPYCQYRQKYPHPFKDHVFTHYNGKYKCNFCSDKFTESTILKRHLLCHNKVNCKVQCSYCKKLFEKETIRRHILFHHVKEMDYHCFYCDYKCHSRSKIHIHIRYYHMKPTSTKNYKCTKCEMKFTRAGLKRHFRNAHSTTEKYDCKHCSLSFNTKYESVLHMNTIHLSCNELKCNDCKYIGKNKDDLISHIFNKHQIVMYCNYCRYKCFQKYRLRDHILTKHNFQTNCKLKCKQCKYVTNRKDLLNQHVNTKHNPNAIIYECFHCGHKNKVKHKLSQHMQTKHRDLLKKRHKKRKRNK